MALKIVRIHPTCATFRSRATRPSLSEMSLAGDYYA